MALNILSNIIFVLTPFVNGLENHKLDLQQLRINLIGTNLLGKRNTNLFNATATPFTPIEV